MREREKKKNKTLKKQQWHYLKRTKVKEIKLWKRRRMIILKCVEVDEGKEKGNNGV